MSVEAPNWYIEQWRAGAMHVYQSGGFQLRNTTTPPVKMDGKKMHFSVAGKVEAEENVQTGDTAIPMNGARTNVEVTTAKSRAFDEVYEDDLDQMTVDEQQVVYESSAMALGRVHDKTVLRAAKDGSTITAIGSFTTPTTPLLALQAKQKLQAQSVPVADGNLFYATNSVGWAVLMTYEIFSSADYNGPDLPFTKAGLSRTWNGMHFFCVDDGVLTSAGLITGTEAYDLLWHRSAMGFGFVRQITGNVVWDNRKDCWTHNMRMRIGAKALLGNGIVPVKNDYDAAHIALPA